ncbi:hypothetical protein BRD16_06665 [Halobacteriales archaeon SW_6_65_46]|nr:MAG: hypothetical protein BRD16_06665 [Halobacteriales archaeon SW_6_65_46]
MAADTDRPDWLPLAGLFAAAIAIAGVGTYVFSQAGLERVGTLIWVLGYGGVIATGWALWFRGQTFEPQ